MLRQARRFTLLAGAVMAPCLLVVPAASAASNACSKVSASAVSAIVGHSVPAGTFSTLKIPATKKNDETSAVETTCTYGAETSEAAIPKVVILDTEVASRTLTYSEMKSSVAKVQGASAALKLHQYSGLGIPGVFFTESFSGIKAEGIAGFQGTKSYGADVFMQLPESKLAALAKLAANI